MNVDSDDEVLCAVAAYYVLLSGECLGKKTRKVRKRRWWMGTLNNQSRER